MFFAFILLLISSYFFEKILSIQNNTLASRQSWHSYKKVGGPHLVGLPGRDDFFIERQALAGENLNLGVWFGYNDILYKEPLSDLENFNVQFVLNSDASYLWVYLNCDTESCLAFRSSAHPAFPTGLYKIKNTGELLQTLAPGPLLTRGSHQLKISKKEDAQEAMYSLFIDNTFVQDVEYKLPFNPLRLRGGEKPTTVTSINFTDLQKKTHRVDFKAPFSFNRFFILLSILFLLSLAVFYKKAWNYVFLFNLLILLFSFMLFSFDNYYWSRLYVTGRHDPINEKNHSFVISLEKIRKILTENHEDVFAQENFFNTRSWFVPLEKQRAKKRWLFDFKDYILFDPAVGATTFNEDITPNILDYNKKNYLKIAFIGGSQTWGAGATRPETTWASLVVKDLAKNTRRQVVGINFAICGGVLADFIPRADLLVALKPDLLIINFGSNDHSTDVEVFKLQFQNLINKLLSAKINVLVSIEAISYEHNPKGSPHKGEVLLELAQKYNLELVSLHNYFSSTNIRDSGLMWQDLVHFTDFGQAQAAKFFINTSAYKKLIQK